MARHNKAFTDHAGFTRHCWECVHAKGWTPNVFSGPWATCELTGRSVKRLDSPDNQCSHRPVECWYRRWDA